MFKNQKFLIAALALFSLTAVSGCNRAQVHDNNGNVSLPSHPNIDVSNICIEGITYLLFADKQTKLFHVETKLDLHSRIVPCQANNN
jgi:hypothetical protein